MYLLHFHNAFFLIFQHHFFTLLMFSILNFCLHFSYAVFNQVFHSHTLPFPSHPLEVLPKPPPSCPTNTGLTNSPLLSINTPALLKTNYRAVVSTLLPSLFYQAHKTPLIYSI